MKKNRPKKLPITIPEQAVRELDQVEGMNPEFTMPELVEWVNDVVARFHPEANEGRDKRVSDTFTVRTLRHYQTLGCLDAPEKQGRRAIYRFRHYVQALLIRKLLFLRHPPEAIREALAGKSTKQYKKMLFSDIRIAERKGKTQDSNAATPRPARPRVEKWTRITVSENIELHLKSPPRRMDAIDQKRLLDQIEQVLKSI